MVSESRPRVERSENTERNESDCDDDGRQPVASVCRPASDDGCEEIVSVYLLEQRCHR